MDASLAVVTADIAEGLVTVVVTPNPEPHKTPIRVSVVLPAPGVIGGVVGDVEDAFSEVVGDPSNGVVVLHPAHSLNVHVQSAVFVQVNAPENDPADALSFQKTAAVTNVLVATSVVANSVDQPAGGVIALVSDTVPAGTTVTTIMLPAETEIALVTVTVVTPEAEPLFTEPETKVGLAIPDL